MTPETPETPNAYDRLDVPAVINGVGTKTRVGGTLIREEAVAAMRDAATGFARISDLQARASERIAAATGAGAGYVTTGAAAGLTLAAAACIAGDDPGAMARLPDTGGLASEILMPRAQRNSYDHALRAAGATITDVGTNDRTLGPGSTNLEPWELSAAVGEETVAVAYAPGDPTPLSTVCAVAGEHDLPVIVDGAGRLPPAENLSRFVDAGAALVVFSGGKAIRGPQSTGIVAGRADLIGSIALQALDMDAVAETWDPPEAFVDRDAIDGVPRHGIGRGFKVGKEEIVGLLRALELFVAEDADARAAEWDGRARRIAGALSGIPALDVAVEDAATDGSVPTVAAAVDEDAAGPSAVELVRRLRGGDPRVYVGDRRATEGVFTVDPRSLSDEEAEYVVERVRAILDA
jgi:L-seryl-tRNA(Ser) seleniumtransferase